MRWSSAQAERLIYEKTILQYELPQFTMGGIDGSGYTHVEGWEISSGYRYEYMLVAAIPRGYPEDTPRLFVAEPNSLFRYDGTPIPPSSHDFHTGPRHPTTNAVEICHCSPSLWNPSMTLTGTLFRGLLWLYCYEEHLRTGRTIENVYEELRRRTG